MKKKLLILFTILTLSVCSMLLCISASAATYSGSCGTNVTYTLDTSTGVLKIEGTGAMKDYLSSSFIPWYSYSSNIKTVIIENGVTSIGDFAFSSCSSLTAIEVDENNAYYCDIDGVLFNKDKTTIITYPADSSTTYVIPDSVTSIGSSAFYGCSSLTSVTIPDSVKSIDNYAFEDCSSLTSVTIPDSVTSIGFGAFSGCSSLTSVTIPDSVTSIGGAFSGCSSLTSVTIPDSVTSIGDWAFSSCSSLTSVTIPDSVTSIGDWAFSSCSSLTSVTIGNSVTSIGFGAFSDCSSLTSVTIPHSVTSIGGEAFVGCSSLTSVTIGNSVTSIGGGAFYCCSSLTAIEVDENNAYYCDIDGVLFNRDKTTIITYPAGSSTTYVIPDSVTSIGYYAFDGCSSLKSVTIPDSVTSIGYRAFVGCSSLTSVTIGNSVTSIGDSAFWYCSSLTSVTIGNSVKSIGDSAFSNCSSLTSVTIGNSVTSIGDSAFCYCSSLTSVTIPDSVTSIGDDAFRNCDSLTSVTFLTKDVTISSNAFNSCSALKTIYLYRNSTADTYFSSDEYTKIYLAPESDFEYTVNADGKTVTITEYVGEGGEVIIPATISGYSVTGIGYGAFYYSINLTSVTIPDSVTSIGDEAFQYCSSLTSVTIGNSVTSIGDFAFYYCSRLTSVTIPDSVTSIGDSAFSGCSSLTAIEVDENNAYYCDIDGVLFNKDKTTIITYPAGGSTTYVIPDSVTSIGGYAFYLCHSLTSVTIPDSVTGIGEWSFSYCYSLTSVTIPDSVTSIGNSAFYYCNSLTNVTFLTKNATIRSSAFDGCSALKTIYLYRNSTADSYFSSDKYTKIYLDDLTYTVTYDVSGGSDAPEAQVKDYGVDLTLSADVPTLAGHTFKGWSTTADGEVEYAAGATYTANADVTLYAVWEISENELTVDDKILTFNGFQLRKDEYNGLRFRFTADYTKMAELEKAGYEVVEFGTLMAATYKLESLDELVVAKNENGEYETLSIAKMVPIYSGGKIVNKYITKTAEQLTFACTVINYTVNTFDLEVTVRGYAVIRDANGNEYVVYTDYPNENYRSLSLERVCDELSAAGLIDTATNISYINVTAFKKEREALEA